MADPSVIISGLALVVAMVSLGVSAVSLYVSNLRPFGLTTTTSNPMFSYYLAVGGDRIPSFDLTLSFTNTGRRTGVVSDVMLMAALEEGRRREFVFRPRFVVDYTRFEPVRHHREDWTRSAVQQPWLPIVLGPGTTVTQHVIFEAETPWRHAPDGLLQAELYIVHPAGTTDDHDGLWLLNIRDQMYQVGGSWSMLTPDQFQSEERASRRG